MQLLQGVFGFIGRIFNAIVGRPSGEGAPQTPPAEGGSEPQPEPPPSEAPSRQWTLMIYMAGDNGLKFETGTGWTQIMHEMTSAGYTDITELRTAGSSDQVAAVVQFDTVTESDRSYRIVINAKGELPTVHEIAETNTGDPNTLRDFIVWGQRTFPAEHYAVVIWNHGGGWKEDDIYSGVRGEAPERPALFRSTLAAIRRQGKEGERWIAADDTSKDFLDNHELQEAFQEAQAISGQRVDLIGMDACLMAMVEVAYQLRENADYLIASEEVEPMPGWEYTSLLQLLNRNPRIPPADLARQIVQLYGESYASSAAEITQSAIALGQLEPLAQALRRFVAAVEENWRADAVYGAMERAKLYTLAFEDSDYRDLYDFMQRVQRHLEEIGQGATTSGENAVDADAIDTVAEAAQAVLALLDAAERSPVRENLVRGQRFQDPQSGQPRVHGLSIYLPQRGSAVSPVYEKLDFQSSRWGDLVRLISTETD